MVFKIVWTNEALKTYLDNIAYLQKEWPEKVTQNFIRAVDVKLHLMMAQPEIGTLTGKYPNVRKTLVHKRISLIYKVKTGKQQIDLLQFFNNWQHPRRMRKN